MNATLRSPAHLHLVCGRCTREMGFAGAPEEAETLAAKADWLIVGQRVTCPRCPGFRPDPNFPDDRSKDLYRYGGEIFTCPCGHKRNLKPGDTQKYCPACKTVAV